MLCLCNCTPGLRAPARSREKKKGRPPPSAFPITPATVSDGSTVRSLLRLGEQSPKLEVRKPRNRARKTAASCEKTAMTAMVSARKGRRSAGLSEKILEQPGASSDFAQDEEAATTPSAHRTRFGRFGRKVPRGCASRKQSRKFDKKNWCPTSLPPKPVAFSRGQFCLHLRRKKTQAGCTNPQCPGSSVQIKSMLYRNLSGRFPVHTSQFTWYIRLCISQSQSLHVWHHIYTLDHFGWFQGSMYGHTRHTR